MITAEQELQLVKYCESTVNLYVELTTKDCHRFFQLAYANKLTYPHKWNKTEVATEDWLVAFLGRNPHLTLRTPQATSLSHAINFNNENFFYKLSAVLET